MDGEKLLRENFEHDVINKKAKGVILFIGDGMGISTVTAARILEWQLKKMSGEAKKLLENDPSQVRTQTPVERLR